MLLTSDEHRREADEFDSTSGEAFAAGNLPRALFLAQRAQVHATLALSADRTVPADGPIHDGHKSAGERAHCGCAAGSSPVRMSREFALTHIGTLMPPLWDWERLQDEFVGAFGVAMEEASLRELGQFGERLAAMRRARERDTCPF